MPLTSASPRRRLLAIGYVAGIITIVIVLGIRHPDTVAYAPICPLNASTGLYCPGCGTGRAIHHVTNGRLEAAWNLNPMLLIIGIPLILFLILSETRLAISGVIRPAGRWMIRVTLAAAILLLAWGIVRNLPIKSPIPLVPTEDARSAAEKDVASGKPLAMPLLQSFAYEHDGRPA